MTDLMTPEQARATICVGCERDTHRHVAPACEHWDYGFDQDRPRMGACPHGRPRPRDHGNCRPFPVLDMVRKADGSIRIEGGTR